MSGAAMALPGVVEKGAFVAARKADLRVAIQDMVCQGIEKAVDRTFGRLTDSMAVAGALMAQNRQQKHEMRSQVVQMHQEVAGVM